MKPVLPALAATFAIQILLSTSALVGPVLAPIAAADLGVDAARVGFFVSSIYIFAAPVGLISGGFIARFGGLRVSQVCLAAAAVALTLAAIGSVWLLPLVVILLGLGVGPSTPASSQILARLTPRHLMNLVFSIKQTAVPLGAALAGLALPSLAIAFGWNAAVLVAGVACLATAVFVQPLRGRFDSTRDTAHQLDIRQQVVRPLRLVLKTPGAFHLGVMAFVYAGLQTCVSSVLVTFLVQQVGQSPVRAGLVLSTTQASAAVARVVWAAVADRYVSPYAMMGALGIVSAVCAFITATFSPAWPFFPLAAVCVVFGISSTGWNGIFLAQIARLAPPGRAGELTGGTTLYNFGGVVILPAIFSAILAATNSYAVAFVALAVPTLVAGATLIRRRDDAERAA